MPWGVGDELNLALVRVLAARNNLNCSATRYVPQALLIIGRDVFHFRYLPAATTPTGKGRKGAIISMANGKATAHALHSLESRGKLFIVPADEVYDGQIVGEANIQQDYEVNPGKQKQLTNIRAAGKDEFVQLAPVRKMSIEDCIGLVTFRTPTAVHRPPPSPRCLPSAMSTVSGK